MLRSRFVAIVALATLAGLPTLACSREAAPGPEIKDPASAPTPEAPRSPPPPPTTATTPPPSQPTAPPATAAAPEPPPDFAMMEVAPTQGDLIPVLKAQAERAKEKKLRPVAYFYADWCPPCKLFQANLEQPQMKEALRGVYLVKLNLDDWHDKAKSSGVYIVKFIPSFFLVQPDGKPFGKLLDGDKWGRKATVETLATSLTKFLAQGT